MTFETTKSPDQPLKTEVLRDFRKEAQRMIAHHHDQLEQLPKPQNKKEAAEFALIQMEKTEEFRRDLEDFLNKHRQAFSREEALALLGSVHSALIKIAA